MRILAFSDLHRDAVAATAIVEAARNADLVIGAGDFATVHQGLDEAMTWLDPMQDKAVYVPGNNETEAALRNATDARVLHGATTVFEGVTIAGIGCAIPPLPSPPWPSFDLDEEDARDMLSGIARADILITHSPPSGACDRLQDGRSIGSVAVCEAIERLQPQFVFCGHVHPSWGERARIGRSTIANLGPSVNWFEIKQ
ncbi:MAG: metallophosphoesterase family protein [Rubricella sp.]